MTTSTITDTTPTTCAICSRVSAYAKTVDIWVGKEETHYEICGPCHRDVRHLSTSTKSRFDSLPKLEVA